jgi:predicted Zn-dependent protease
MRNYLKLFIITLLIVISSCSLKRKNNYAVDMKPVISQAYYIDASFNAAQTVAIQEAMDEWNTATRGLTHLTIAGVVRFESIDPNFDYGKNVIIKTDSNNAFVKEQNNKFYGKAEVVGLQMSTIDGKYNEIYIVSDEIANMTQYKLNVIHELGHAISMKHVDDAAAVMNTQFNKNVRCLTHRDVKQFCDLYTCNPEDMNYCEDYNISNQMFH